MPKHIGKKTLFLILVAGLIAYAGIYMSSSEGSWAGLGLRLPFYLLGALLVCSSLYVENQPGFRRNVRMALSALLLGSGTCVWSISSGEWESSPGHMLMSLASWLVWASIAVLSVEWMKSPQREKEDPAGEDEY